MSSIVGVHGIAQQYESPVTLAREWRDGLLGGLQLATRDEGNAPKDLALAKPTFGLAFYGDVFRPLGKGVLLTNLLGAHDLTEAEQRLLLCLWEETARTDSGVPPPAGSYKTMGPARTAMAQRALLALSRSRYFGPRLAGRLPGVLRQVSRYFADLDIRLAARKFVEEQVSEETRIFVGHSLGSVVAYEALCANPEWNVSTLITLGSPLGIPNIVFERLWPEPGNSGLGRWPGSVRTWVNIADRRDPVALVKKLDGLFAGSKIEDVPIDNGPTEHNIRPYLSARQTGCAILAALRE